MLRPLILTSIACALICRASATDLRELTGREAEAVALALKVFKSKQGSKDEAGHPVYGDLKHYSVELRRDADKLQVAFVPETRDSTASGPYTVGGATEYGWAVIYVIALDKMKILDEHYSR